MRVLLVVSVLGSAAAFGQPAGSSPNEKVFNEKIAPLLQANCAQCHGSASPSGGLGMAGLSSLLSGGKHGPALEPGDSKQSLLMQYVRGERTPRMPMGGSLPGGDDRFAGCGDRPDAGPAEDGEENSIRTWSGCCTSRRLRRFRQ